MQSRIEHRIQELTGEFIRQQAIRGEADRQAQVIQVIIAELQKLIEQEKAGKNGETPQAIRK